MYDPALHHATELLDVVNAAELDRRVHALVAGTARGLGRPLPARVEGALAGELTRVVRATLPALALLDPPGATHAEADAAARAARVLDVELEGLSPEDRDLEIAGELVELVRAATARALGAPVPAPLAGRLDAARTAAAAHDAADDPGRATTDRTRTHARGRGAQEMFETSEVAGYGQAGYGRHRGQGRSPWWDDDEGGDGPGEYDEAELDAAEYAQGAYAGEDEYDGEDEGAYAGELDTEYDGEDEYDREGGYDGEQEEDEEQLLPLVPVVGKVLGGLLGGLVKEVESGELDEIEAGEVDQGEDELGEAEEQFLGGVLKAVLGRAVGQRPVLSPAQEAQLAAELLEVADERELDQFLGKIVSNVGRLVSGVSKAARSPVGKALVRAVTPLAKAALPTIGGAVGSLIAPGIGTAVGTSLGSAASRLLEVDAEGLDPEQEQFETARRVVRLTAAAAQDAAAAPAGAPAELVGELSVVRAGRQHAPRVFRGAVRRVAPLARRAGTRPRYGGPHRGYAPRGRRAPAGGARRYPRGYRPPYPRPPRPYVPRYGYPVPYGYPAAGPEPEPGGPGPSPVPPPQPGFRWVAVPVGASAPAPAEPSAEPSAPPADEPDPTDPAGPEGEYGYRRYGRRRPGQGGGRDDGQDGGARSGRWYRRGGSIVLVGA